MKPILFNSAMVRATLDGRKTCTRRVIKFTEGLTGLRAVGEAGNPNNPFGLWYAGGIKRPPYNPGDILYVRETWAHGCMSGYIYKAGHEYADKLAELKQWKPSIHMPADAARIFLRVTDVRVERLHDIGMSGIRAEGVVPPLVTGGTIHQWLYEYFIPVWNSTVKRTEMERYGWPGNPWVWVIEFERIEKEDAET